MLSHVKYRKSNFRRIKKIYIISRCPRLKENGTEYSVLLKYIDALEQKLKAKWDNPQKLKLVVHLGCALERMVVHEGLKFDPKRINEVDMQKFTIVKQEAELFKQTLQIELSDDELKYIVTML